MSIDSMRPDNRGEASDLLRPDNHALWTHVRLMAVARDPVLSWEEIAKNVGLDETDVPALLAWFISYRLPPMANVLPPSPGIEPRDPELRAELRRLRRREESLVTVANESPMQLAIVQGRIKSLERSH